MLIANHLAITSAQENLNVSMLVVEIILSNSQLQQLKQNSISCKTVFPSSYGKKFNQSSVKNRSGLDSVEKKKVFIFFHPDEKNHSRKITNSIEKRNDAIVNLVP